jgi:anthranilate phosphoribosyltransferase
MFHPAMRHAAPVRAELGIPTVFNLLGPLSHPAQVGRVVLGVTDPTRVQLLADVLSARGVPHAWVVHGDGLDELTVTGSTTVVEVREGHARRLEVTPEEVGLQRATHAEIAVGDPADNARAAEELLQGGRGPVRDMVVLNAAAGLVVCGLAGGLVEGVEAAAAAIDDGRATRTLGELVAVSRAIVQAPAAD